MHNSTGDNTCRKFSFETHFDSSDFFLVFIMNYFNDYD